MNLVFKFCILSLLYGDLAPYVSASCSGKLTVEEEIEAADMVFSISNHSYGYSLPEGFWEEFTVDKTIKGDAIVGAKFKLNIITPSIHVRANGRRDTRNTFYSKANFVTPRRYRFMAGDALRMSDYQCVGTYRDKDYDRYFDDPDNFQDLTDHCANQIDQADKSRFLTQGELVLEDEYCREQVKEFSRQYRGVEAQ